MVLAVSTAHVRTVAYNDGKERVGIQVLFSLEDNSFLWYDYHNWRSYLMTTIIRSPLFGTTLVIADDRDDSININGEVYAKRWSVDHP